VTSSERPFADLLATPGVIEELELRGSFGFMAYHGGSLEEMTDVVGRAAAERSGASFYAVLQPPDLNWHIPSHHVSPDQSPAMAAFVEHVDVVVTVHGFGRRGLFTSLLLGGQNRALAEHIGDSLRAALPAYDILTDADLIPRDLRGMHADNPVNLPRRQGVQIELPPRVRGSSALWADWEGPGLTPHTEALVAALAEAAVSWNALPSARTA
jgi:phage replication-related protein YjqB (UPF0714/DUF867 family)